MSFTFELRGSIEDQWSLTSNCVEQITRLATLPISASAVIAIFGDRLGQSGTARQVSRKQLLPAIETLLAEAQNSVRGFQVRVPKRGRDAGKGAAGLLINGVFHAVFCSGCSWTLRSIDDITKQTVEVQRFEPATIETDNIGPVIVEEKSTCFSDLARLLCEIQGFLEKDPSEHLVATWG